MNDNKNLTINDYKDDDIDKEETNQKDDSRKAKYPVLTLEKALDIINFFKEHPGS